MQSFPFIIILFPHSVNLIPLQDIFTHPLFCGKILTNGVITTICAIFRGIHSDLVKEEMNHETDLSGRR